MNTHERRCAKWLSVGNPTKITRNDFLDTARKPAFVLHYVTWRDPKKIDIRSCRGTLTSRRFPVQHLVQMRIRPPVKAVASARFAAIRSDASRR
jgi:hypothetical protein